MSGIPPMSREMAAVYARQEMAAYAFIRAWMADDVYKGMLLIEQQNIPKESVIFVLSLVKAARRALLRRLGIASIMPLRSWTSGWKTPGSVPHDGLRSR